MRVIADLHIHSPYSRAVSRDMTIPNLDVWGRKKGIKIIGTGDFTHPQWLQHLKEELVPAEPGLFKLKSADTSTRFLLSTEISSIYSDGGKVRRVHNVVLAPSFDVVDRINADMASRGAKLTKDGRPIVGLSSRELLNICLNASPDCLFIPAHIWTPWFAVFGSKSGYDSIEECFGEDAKYIYALETGLSSDKEMNWRISALDKYTLISNSDPHSLRRLGRECNVFEIDPANLSYFEIARIIKEKDNRSFVCTIEYFPEEGRYHYDGERDHAICLAPAESKKLNQRCPDCGKALTIGVLSRVEQLADRPAGFVPSNAIPGKRTVQLEEIIMDALGLKSATGKAVSSIYEKMVSRYAGGEMGILLDASQAEIAAISNQVIAEGVARMRRGEVRISPGYDGVYGKIKIFNNEEREAFTGHQTALF